MNARTYRFAREHPRAAMSAILVLVYAIALFLPLKFIHDGRASAPVMLTVFLFGLLVAIGFQLYLKSKGRLVIRDRVKREEQSATEQALTYGFLGLSAPIALVTNQSFTATLLALCGGLVVAYTPLLIWVVWVLRPAERGFE